MFKNKTSTRQSESNAVKNCPYLQIAVTKQPLYEHRWASTSGASTSADVQLYLQKKRPLLRKLHLEPWRLQCWNYFFIFCGRRGVNELHKIREPLVDKTSFFTEGEEYKYLHSSTHWHWALSKATAHYPNTIKILCIFCSGFFLLHRCSVFRGTCLSMFF